MLYECLVSKLHHFPAFYSLLNTNQWLLCNNSKTGSSARLCGLTQGIYGNNLYKAWA